MINDIAMRPAVTEAYKIFSDTAFDNTIRRTYGKEYADLMMPYLHDIAGQRRYTDQFAVTGGRILEYFYQNLVATMIGFNPGTVLKHFPTALANSANAVGKEDFLKEFLNTWLNPQGWANVGYVMAKSNALATLLPSS